MDPQPPTAPRELLPVDVARIWTEEARKKDPDAKEVPVETVYSYVTKSRPAKPGIKAPRYANTPVPPALATRDKFRPAWKAEQEQELRDWWNNRPGRGAGGGRPRKTDEG